MIVRDRSGRDPGVVDVSFKADIFEDSVDESDLPVHVSVVFDAPVAAEGQCAEAHFDGIEASCELGRRGDSISCR